MLSSRVRYAIAALTALARNPERPRTAERLAAVTGAPLATLSKVLQALARARLIGASRGPHGGVRLAKDAENISVLDVVGAVDSAARRRMLRSESLGPCLYRRLELLRRVVTLVLDRTTIAELAGTPPQGANDERPPVSIDELLARAIEAWDRAFAGISDGRRENSSGALCRGDAAADLRQTGKRLDL